MRRRLNLSLESALLNSSPVLSLEEEQIMMSDAADLAGEINHELNECDRIIEVSDALEDLAVIADEIEQASPVEIALIEKAGDMAVAGTDIEAEEVVPSMESFRGKRIATEGFRDTAALIWKNIQEFLKVVWEKIEKFFYNIFGTIPNIRRRLEGLAKKIEAASSKSPRGTVFEVNTSTGLSGSVIGRLSTSGKLPRNDNEFLAELKKLGEFTEFIYGANIINRNNLGQGIANAIEKFDPSINVEQQAAALGIIITDFNKKQTIPGTRKSSVSGSYEIHRSDELIGGASLVAKVFVNTDTSVLGLLDRLRHSGIIFDQNNDKVNSAGKTQLPIVSLTTMTSMIKELQGVLDGLEEYKRSAASKATTATRKKLESASKKAAESFASGDPTSSSVQHFRAMLNFNSAFARWVDDPAIPFARYAISEINAVVAFIGMCLSTYK